jgi:energy-coupling factor transport system permease protein
MPLAVVAFTFANPIVLLAAGAGAWLAGALSGARNSVAQPLRWSLGLAVMVVAVNAIASQRGATILVRGFDFPALGQIDVSLEALVEGSVLALRIVVALLVFAVWSACVDPDRILRAIRPIAARSALTATLVSRLVPIAAADGARMAEAARLRGPGAVPVGRAALARRLVAGSLDRSVDIAATLELRGYGTGTRSRMPRHPRERGEAGLLAAGLVSLLAVALAALAGVAAFDAYPTISMDADPATFALAIAVVLLAAAPLVPEHLHRRSVLRA